MEAHPRVFGKVFAASSVRARRAASCPKVLRNLTETLKWEDELASQTRKLAMYSRKEAQHHRRSATLPDDGVCQALCP